MNGWLAARNILAVRLDNIGDVIMLGPALRAGESKEFGGSTLTTELCSASDQLHQVERNLRLIEHLGFVARDRQLKISIPEKDRAVVPTLLAQAGLNLHDPFLLLHPGASAQARRYPVERFGLLSRVLTRRGWPVLITGIEREATLIEELLEYAPKAHRLVGTTLAEYTALIERAALVICNDSLPMHLADALRTPEVVLFSGTDYEKQWRPRATRSRLLRRATACHPCYLFECPIGLVCLDIAPEEVVEEVEALLENVRTVKVVDQPLRAGENR